MHLILETEDGSKEILIPSGTVVSQIIQKESTDLPQKPIRTSLLLDPPREIVDEGAVIKFTGKILETKTEKPVSDSIIKIFDSDLGLDDPIESGESDEDGSFKIEWIAKQIDRWDKTVEIYAKFEGDENHRSSESKKHVINLENQ